MINNHINPACLPIHDSLSATSFLFSDGKTVTASGFGFNDTRQAVPIERTTPHTLQQVTRQILPSGECSHTLGSPLAGSLLCTVVATSRQCESLYQAGCSEY